MSQEGVTSEDLLAIERLIEGLSPEKRKRLEEIPEIKARANKWVANPGPQTRAYYCEADELLFGGEAGGGKEQPRDAGVLTPHGWVEIGSLTVGDDVTATDGSVTHVVGVYPQGVKDIYRVTMEDGGSTEAGLDHNWLAWAVEDGHAALARKWKTSEILRVLDVQVRVELPLLGAGHIWRGGGRPIQDIQYSRRAEAVCIQVAHPNSLYITDDFIVTHNSDLLIGLAKNEHTDSRILRRINQDAQELGERLVDIMGTRDGFTLNPPKYKANGQLIEFSGCELERDKQRFKGKARDFFGYDELADFLESQYVFINTWNRSVKKGQRCRIVGATNGPTTAEGQWIVRRWAAWLDPKHPNPAADGELRWYLGNAEEEQEVDGPGPHLHRGKMIKASSRTFIRSRLEDNPDLIETDYGDRLESLPDELYRVYRKGDFTVGLRDDDWQVIPTEWIELAQRRWTERSPDGVAMTAIGVDVAPGGGDKRVIAPRYGGWFAPLNVAREIDKDGVMTAAEVVKIRRANCPVIVDMGGGWGGEAAIAMKDNGILVVSYMGVDPSRAVSLSGQRFFNKRAETIWRMREELDPMQEGGSPIALPPDDGELMGDLASFRWELTTRGIRIEEKVAIKARLGRSPDRGEAVCMCLAPGNAAVAREAKKSKGMKVILGYGSAKKRRR